MRHRRIRVLLLVAATMGSIGGSWAGELSGTLVILNKAEATASLLEVSTGKVRATLPTGEGPHEAAVSPDGRIAVAANYGVRGRPGSSLTVIDVAAAEVVRTIDLGEHRRPHGLVWYADGRRLIVTVEASRAVLEVDVNAGEVTRVLRTDQDVSHMVELAASGKRAFVANIGSGTVTVIDLEGAEPARSIPTGEGAEGLTASADGSEIWVTNRADDTVTVLDAETLATKATIPCASFPIRAEATPDGKYVLVSCARSGDLAVLDAATKKELRRVSMDLAAIGTEGRLFGDRFGTSSVPVGVLVDPSGRRAWVAHTNADAVVEVDLASWKVVRVLEAGKEPDGMDYSSVTVK